MNAKIIKKEKQKVDVYRLKLDERNEEGYYCRTLYIYEKHCYKHTKIIDNILINKISFDVYAH